MSAAPCETGEQEPGARNRKGSRFADSAIYDRQDSYPPDYAAAVGF